MKSWNHLSHIITEVATHVRPNVTTMTLNNVAAKLIKEHNAASALKDYWPVWSPDPYPYETCISVNHQIAHGIPSDLPLREGDLVNIDIGIYKGNHAADASITVPVGNISEQDAELLHYAKKALYAGIQRVRAGAKIDLIARAIEETAWIKKYVVNVTFGGHGIGSKIHQPPDIYHARNPYHSDPVKAAAYQKYMEVELEAGQIICLEPMLTKGDRYGAPSGDGWSWVTRGGTNSACFEEMILVKEDGYEILTTHLKEEHDKYLGK